MQFTFDTIALVHSCYKQKFGIPRQAGLCPSTQARIEILPPYNRLEAFVELKQTSHIWVQFVFHANRSSTWKPKVKAPRLGGNKRISVFATRSPVRPNPIGLSVVKLETIEYSSKGLFLVIRGGDFLDGTPVLDIKPYVPYSDCLNDAKNSFADDAPKTFKVSIAKTAQTQIETADIENFAAIIIETLQLNPAPQYHLLNAIHKKNNENWESDDHLEKNANENLHKKLEKNYALQLFNYDILWRHESTNSIEVFDIVKLRNF